VVRRGAEGGAEETGGAANPGGGPGYRARPAGGGGGAIGALGIGVLVMVGMKLRAGWLISQAAAVAAALAYAWPGDTGAERSAKERRVRLPPRSVRLLMVWRRLAELSRCLQGWMLLSRTRAAASALSTAAREVRIRFMSTLASSWIIKTVLNNMKKFEITEAKERSVPVPVPVPNHFLGTVPVPARTLLLSVNVKFRRIIRFLYFCALTDNPIKLNF
jgi:hypothetical protein